MLGVGPLVCALHGCWFDVGLLIGFLRTWSCTNHLRQLSQQRHVHSTFERLPSPLLAASLPAWSRPARAAGDFSSRPSDCGRRESSGGCPRLCGRQGSSGGCPRLCGRRGSSGGCPRLAVRQFRLWTKALQLTAPLPGCCTGHTAFDQGALRKEAGIFGTIQFSTFRFVSRGPWRC